MFVKLLIWMLILVPCFAEDLSVVSLKEVDEQRVVNDEYSLFYRIEGNEKKSFYEFSVTEAVYNEMKAFVLPEGLPEAWSLNAKVFDEQGVLLEEVVFNSRYIFTDRRGVQIQWMDKRFTLKKVKRPYYVSISPKSNKGLIYLKGTQKKSLVRLPFQGILSSLRDTEVFYISKNTHPQKIIVDSNLDFQTLDPKRIPIVTHCENQEEWKVVLNNKDSLPDDSIQAIQTSLIKGIAEVNKAILAIDTMILNAYGNESDSTYLGFRGRELKENFCKQELSTQLLELEETQKQLDLIFKIKTIEDDNFRSRSGEEQFNILYEDFKDKNILIDFKVGLVYSLSEDKYLTSPSEVMGFSSGINYCFYLTKNHCLAPFVNYQYSRWYFDSALDQYSEEWRGDYGASWYFPLLFRPGKETMLLSLKFDFFGIYSENIVRSYKVESDQVKSYGTASSLILRWSDSPLGYIGTMNYSANKDFILSLGLLFSIGVK